jgi:hypothetical protein
LFLPKYDNVILCGDWNFDFNKDSSCKKNILSTLNDLNLKLLPIFNTNHSVAKGKQSVIHTTIDVICIKKDIDVPNCNKLTVSGISAHDLVYCVYPITHCKPKQKIKIIRDFSNFDIVKLKEDASKISWLNIMLLDNLNDKVAFLNDNILYLYNKHAPLKSIRVSKPTMPWVTKDIKTLMKERDKARIKANNIKSFDLYLNFKKMRNKVKQLLRNSYRKFMLIKLAIKSSATLMWKNLKKFGLIKSLENSINLDLNLLNDSFIRKPILNDVIKNDTCNQYKNNIKSNCEPFYFSYVYPDKIDQTFKQIKSKAVGIDKIGIDMINPILDMLIPSFEHIFNFSLQNGIYPDLWKEALVQPIPKVKNPINVSDCRPISHICVQAKALEKIACEQITNYVEHNKLLDTYQSGFRKYHSCCTALLKIIEDIRNAINKNLITIMILLDFSKAFDSVDPDILVSKLENLNFSKSSTCWIQSFLTNRSQCVLGDNNTSSTMKPLYIGCPQGSSLSPLFYALYTFDIAWPLIFCKHHLYADDEQLYIHTDVKNVNDTIKKINVDLASVSLWSQRHGLQLNASKTQAIIFGSKHCINKLGTMIVDLPVLDGQHINFSDYVKNLGVMMDSILSWRQQISYVSQRVYIALNQLYKFRNNTPVKTRIQLVKSLIYPIMDYCSIIYCDASLELENKLDKLVNNCIRYIFDLRKYDHISAYYDELGWLRISERRDFHSVYKMLHKQQPPYLADILVLMSQVHDRQTRSHSLYLQVPKTKITNFALKSAKLWNRLPAKICNFETFKSFKQQLFSFMN